MVALWCTAEFSVFLRYARNMQFTDAPNYSYLNGLFLGLMKRCGWTLDWDFDWLALDLVSECRAACVCVCIECFVTVGCLGVRKGILSLQNLTE